MLLKRFLGGVVLLGCIGIVAIWQGSLRVPAQASIAYEPGWNLVSGPEGSQLIGAEGSMYTLQAGDSDYEQFPVSSTLRACWGYWAYFPAGGSLDTSGSSRARYCSASGTPDSWIMIGNPSTDPATVANAIQTFSYSAATGYSVARTMPPGSGLFASSAGPIEVTVLNAALVPSPQPAPMHVVETSKAVVSVAVSPTPLTLGLDQQSPVTYTFSESQGIAVVLKRRTYEWDALGGFTLMGPVTDDSISIDVPAGGRIQRNTVIALPANVFRACAGTRIGLVEVWNGTDANGNMISAGSLLQVICAAAVPSP